jgi:Arc/MetJ-type ribon-helix-helix transcriptional regulator
MSPPLPGSQPTKATPSAVRRQTVSEQGSPFASPTYVTRTPTFSEADAVLVTHSPQVFSPAPSDLSIVHAASSFRGQSPVPPHWLPSASIQSLISIHDVFRSPSALVQPSSAEDIAGTETALATTESVAARYRQADENSLRDDLLSMEMLYGTGHHDALRTLLELGRVLIDQGRYRSAEEVIRRSVDAHQSRNGDKNNMHMLDALEFLGIVLYCQGLSSQAEKLHRKVFESRKTLLGSDHLATLQTMGYLASTFCN